MGIAPSFTPEVRWLWPPVGTERKDHELTGVITASEPSWMSGVRHENCRPSVLPCMNLGVLVLVLVRGGCPR